MPKVINPESGRGFTFKDRSGQRSGRLLFTRVVGINSHKHNIWEAICDCGRTTTTSTPHKTRSCGCLQKEIMAGIQKAKALPSHIKDKSRKDSADKQRAKRKSNPLAVMQSRLSRLHRHALSQVNAIKRSRTFDQLGYSVFDFVAHIERQFLKGMGWHNMSDWQIDHIIPIVQAKTEDDVIALNQLSNLRPMWAKENNAKKAKILSLL